MILRLLAALLAVLMAPTAALAATAGNELTIMQATGSAGQPTEDAWYNYDFTQQTISRYNVDWAWSLVFAPWATINRVKSQSALSAEYPYSGSTMNFALRDQYPGVWDQDGGRKQSLCQQGGGRHYRVYAPPATDYMYNLYWGYYVLGSTHYDFDECVGTSWFGYSETAEDWLASRWASTYGGNYVLEDDDYAHNYEPFRVEGDHIWDNNGFRTWFWFF